MIRSVRLAVLFGVVAALATIHAGRAQTGTALFQVGTTVTYPPGWNLVAFGNTTSVRNLGNSGPLLTWQPAGTDYQSTDAQHLTMGNGYWAYFPSRTFVVLPLPNPQTSFSLSMPAGSCAMVGNPSVTGSAQVRGATSVLTYSPSDGTYISTALLGIGQGAWACNGSSVTATVTVTDIGVTTGLDWPDCCDPEPYNNNGQAQILVVNDSPYAETVGMVQVDAAGTLHADSIDYYESEPACNHCPEYAPGQHTQCDPNAPATSLSLPVGRYVFHLHSYGPDVADVQDTVTLAANTSYEVCVFVPSTRPRFPFAQ